MSTPWRITLSGLDRVNEMFPSQVWNLQCTYLTQARPIYKEKTTGLYDQSLLPQKTVAVAVHAQAAKMRSQLLKPDLGDWTGAPSLLSATPQSSWTLCLTWKTSTEIGHGIQRKKCPVWARRVGNTDKVEQVVSIAFTTCTEIQNGENTWETKIIQAQSVHGVPTDRESKYRNLSSCRLPTDRSCSWNTGSW